MRQKGPNSFPVSKRNVKGILLQNYSVLFRLLLRIKMLKGMKLFANYSVLFRSLQQNIKSKNFNSRALPVNILSYIFSRQESKYIIQSLLSRTADLKQETWYLQQIKVLLRSSSLEWRMAKKGTWIQSKLLSFKCFFVLARTYFLTKES